MKAERRVRVPQEEIPLRLRAIERLAASGATIAEACAQSGVALPTYYRWRQRIRAHKAPRAKPGRPSEATRNLVLQAAQAVFLRDGMGVGLNVVAQAAGVTRQTIYNLFGGREGLFAEVVQSLYLKLNAPVFTPDPDADLVAVLEQVGRHHMMFSIDEEAVGLMRVALSEYTSRPELTALAYALRAGRTGANAVGVITGKLTEELARGTIRDVNPYLAAETFIGFSAMLRHRAMIGLPPPPQEELDERLRLAIDLFVEGLGYTPVASPLPVQVGAG